MRDCVLGGWIIKLVQNVNTLFETFTRIIEFVVVVVVLNRQLLYNSMH